MKNKFLYVLLVLVNIKVFSQTEKIIDSEIKKVIVYQQGAFITREAPCSLSKGQTTVILKELSSKIDPYYIQVSTNDDEVTIMSVNHSIDYLNKNKVNKEIELLNNKKKSILDSIKICKNLKFVYSKEKELILTNNSLKGDNGLNINDLQNAATFFRSRLTEIESNIFITDKKMHNLNERLIDISKQLNELNTQIDIPTSQLKIVLSSNKNTTITLSVNYIILDASWTPNYDIRIKNVDNPMVLMYKAKVTQNTGEDWKNVKLVLSTGNPSISNVKPELETYYLTFNNYYSKFQPLKSSVSIKTPFKLEGKVTDGETGEPLPGCNVMIKGTSYGVVSDIDGKFSLNIDNPNSTIVFSYVGYETIELPANSSFSNVKLSPQVNELEEVVVVGYGVNADDSYSDNRAVSYRPVKKEVIPVAIQKQEVSTEFDIDIPYSIPSDNKEYDVSMVEYQIPAIYSYSAVPKLSNDVFLMAKVTDWTKYNMLNGSANIYFKGIYQGATYLDLKSFEDTLSLSIGRDNDIIVKREIQKDFTSKSFSGSIKKEHKGWLITVKNNKNFPVKITIEDQYPISKTDEIKVDLIQTSNAIQDKDKGKLIWNLDLGPNEKKIINLQYSVKYPSNRNVIVE